MNFSKLKFKKGLSLVEVVIAITIITGGFLSLVAVYNTYLNRIGINILNLRAVYLAESGIETVKFLRDQNWTSNIASLNVDTPYYLAFSGGTWTTTTTNTYVDGTFERSFTLSNVNRDINDDITTSGGSNDPGTRLLTMNISWNYKGATTTKTISTYISNIFSN